MEFAAYKTQHLFKLWTSRYPYWFYTEELQKQLELNVQKVRDIVESLEKFGYKIKGDMNEEECKSNEDQAKASVQKFFAEDIRA